MHLERRFIYCYTEYECNQAHQTRNIIMGVCISISFLSIILGTYRYMNKKKKRQANQCQATPSTSAPTSANTQIRPEESNEEQLPPYSSSNQGAQVSLNNPQNSSLSCYHAPPLNPNNAQSREYFPGGFVLPNNSQLNANQPYPRNFNTPTQAQV